MNTTFTGSFQAEHKIGEIVAFFPGASNVFKAYGIDFCCGGGRPLSDAFERQHLNAEEILAKLNAAYEEATRSGEKDVDWTEASYSQLIERIVNTHHGYLVRELPVLSEFVTKVLRVHGGSHPELARVHTLFHQFKMELEQHMIKEEDILFPKIIRFEETGDAKLLEDVQQTIEILESEHDAAGDILKELREITHHYELPDGACRTYTLTYQKLEALENDMFTHVHLENNILFPRVLKHRV
jgi:regulator of cell morphogenesis and NO signaling